VNWSKDRKPHSSETCHYTHGYFTQVDAIIQRVPGALLVVGPPGLLEDLVDALAFLAFDSVAAGDARRPRDAVGSRVPLSARGACWTLNATAKLHTKNTTQGKEEVCDEG